MLSESSETQPGVLGSSVSALIKMMQFVDCENSAIFDGDACDDKAPRVSRGPLYVSNRAVPEEVRFSCASGL